MGASKILFQQLLASLNFTVDAEGLLYWYKQKNWFLWAMAAAQAAEKASEMDEAWPDIYVERNIR